ncbi:ribosomal protein L7/L12 [Actinomadura sp. KC345]|uniref:ribosomal protein L7/L12 n=1 Tax=Actinomadura sp. KC345 TaxID=2530371 RepID=UPI001A9FC0F1|nr:ribosomal protein L7/L12 [Actinomadura sp. KC345]
MTSFVPYVPSETRDRVIVLVERGRHIPAIKLVREATGAGLKEAKEYVDVLKGVVFARAVPPDVQAKVHALLAERRPKEAARLVRKGTGLDSKAAKDYVKALREGRLPTVSQGGPSGVPSDRVREFKHAGDLESAVALACAETGMGRDEALRFVHALG